MNFSRWPLAYLAAVLFLLSAVIAEKFLLYRLTPTDTRGLHWLNKLQIMDHKYKLDFWKEARRLGDHADVMISDKTVHLLESEFQRRNISHSITVPDVEKLIMRNEGHVYKKSSWISKRLKDDPILDSEPDTDHSHVGSLKKVKYPFGDYAAYADMMKYMRTIEFYYPNLTKIIRLGTSHEGKPIEGLKIGVPIPGKRKRAIWIDGNIHAREWASSHTALFVINQLVAGYGKDETITHYLNHLDFYIVPCLNVDGYEYTRSSPIPSVRLWRKNRSPEVCHRSVWGGEKCCRGVDLNRNFHFHWSETGSSYEPCSNIYHGETVFSEPEALAVRDFLYSNEIRGRVDAFITLHSYAQLWIYPYSHEEGNYPDDINDLKRTARRAITKLARMYGTQYRMGTGADTLAPASGGSDDWAKGTLGVKYVYLIELRPQLELSNGFILHKKELIPTAIETFEGLKAVVEAVLEHNHIKRDPVSRISASQRKKQLYRLRLMGLASSLSQTPKESLINGTDLLESGVKGDVVRLEKTFSTQQPHHSRLLTRSHLHSNTVSLTSPSPEINSKAHRHRHLLNSEEQHRLMTTRLRKYSTKIPDYSASAERLSMSQEIATSSMSSSESTTSEEVESTSLTTASTQSLSPTEAPSSEEKKTTKFAFYTNTKPVSFMDPECRDMRYSCGFWLKHNPQVCTEQESFMKAQCAFTCQFCISKLFKAGDV